MIQPDSTHVSPDGAIRIEYSSQEMRMSLWVDTPHVVDAASGRTIFRPDSSLVSGEHTWGADGKFSLGLRKYPDGRFWVNLLFDINAGTVRVDGSDSVHPIADAARIVARKFAEYEATGPSLIFPEPVQPRLFHDLVVTFWGRVRRAFILILIAMLLGMAIGWLPLDRWAARMI